MLRSLLYTFMISCSLYVASAFIKRHYDWEILAGFIRQLSAIEFIWQWRNLNSISYLSLSLNCNQTDENSLDVDMLKKHILPRENDLILYIPISRIHVKMSIHWWSTNDAPRIFDIKDYMVPWPLINWHGHRSYSWVLKNITSISLKYSKAFYRKCILK